MQASRMLRGSKQQQQQQHVVPHHRVQAPCAPHLRARSSANGNGVSSCPTPAETARTVADLAGEGVLCTLGGGDGLPLGTPVAYSLDGCGNPLLQLIPGSPEAANLAAGGRAALLVQPASFPARGLASVALQGTAVQPEPAEAGAAGEGVQLLKLQVERCVYYGGLDHASHGVVVPGDEYRAAEPDPLRRAAPGLITTWNSERAEDVYRIVAGRLGLPLTEMSYAELLWLDARGLYVRAEALGRTPAVVRVPFYRPVLDERDARSVLTMASHINWAAERQYTPPPVASPAAAAGGSN